MKTLLRTSLHNFLKNISCFVLLVLAIIPSNSANAQLRIANLTLEEGLNNRVGSVYRARSIFTNIDALIRVDSLINGATITNIDDDVAGFRDAFQPRIRSGNIGASYAVFSIQFVRSNSTAAEFLASVTVTNLDLDGSSTIRETGEIDLGGGAATFMSNTPEISLTRRNSAFYAENITGRNYNSIDTTAYPVMYKVTNTNITRFTVRLGAIMLNNSSIERQYSIFMRDFVIPNSASLPLTLLNFDALWRKDKVELNWTTTEHKDFSHFVLQRSTDGKNFKDVMTLMTDNVSSSSVNQYNYKDDVSGLSNIVYYRLQMVDGDTKFEYSPIRMVRLNAANTVQIQTFPNPVTSELRVTIPANWQEKTTTYEIYNSTGSLITRKQIARAPQVQQLNVHSLGSGNYIIRVTNGQEVSSSKFIKY